MKNILKREKKGFCLQRAGAGKKAVDTANALVNCLRSDHSLENIPLVDIATLYHRK